MSSRPRGVKMREGKRRRGSLEMCSFFTRLAPRGRALTLTFHRMLMNKTQIFRLDTHLVRCDNMI